MVGDYMEFTKSITASGHYKGGNRLDSTSKLCAMARSSAPTVPLLKPRNSWVAINLVDAKDLDDPGRNLGIARPSNERNHTDLESDCCLYAVLIHLQPSSMVELNRAVAVAKSQAPPKDCCCSTICKLERSSADPSASRRPRRSRSRLKD